MKTKTNISLNSIVSNTETNIEGVRLFCVISEAIKNNTELMLEIDSDMTLSSSFLNSSFGEIIERFDLEKLKSTVKIKTSRTQFQRISEYLNKFNSIYQH